MNRLAHATSAYLRQHADNPVSWWPWSAEALAFAKEQDRPIFLSIGYAACHWCHVMAHESFENPTTAALLNDSFVAIKVDREERPDIDAIYMAATQLTTGRGGWPMSVFLLPDGRPFLAGTYYPPEDRPGQTGFPRLLRALRDAWANQREAVVTQAEQLQTSLEREVAYVDHLAPVATPLDLDAARRLLRLELLEQSDPDGGFGGAPKFPRPSYVDALLEFDDDDAREAVSRTLDAMSRRGLYDHLEGGFARYSVDNEWHVPHFEKMLSDQALLARTYLRAAVVVSRPDWRAVALDTLRFVVKELSVSAGFASSLDADAGGVEGSHVVWSDGEVLAALLSEGREGDVSHVLRRWRITSPGLFEGRSIPRLADDEPFETPPHLFAALNALRSARGVRSQPGRDEKVILEWNAMFASACVKSGDVKLVTVGVDLLASLARSHFKDGVWWRTEQCEAYATASDVAWLIDAALDAFELAGQERWLTYSRDLATYLLGHYWDGDIPSATSPLAGRGIFAQCNLVNDVIARPKEIFDGATPSSHAVACRALARLALITGDNDILAVSGRLVELGAPLLSAHPSAVPDLVAAAGFAIEGIELVIPGETNALSDHVRLRVMPRSVLITGTNSSPLLDYRSPGFAYVCRGGSCALPVSSIEGLDEQLDSLSH